MQTAVNNYIKAKRALTACMQKHFKQLCPRCNKYAGCETYGVYVSTWIELQKYEGKGGELDDQE